MAANSWRRLVRTGAVVGCMLMLGGCRAKPAKPSFPAQLRHDAAHRFSCWLPRWQPIGDANGTTTGDAWSLLLWAKGVPMKADHFSLCVIVSPVPAGSQPETYRDQLVADSLTQSNDKRQAKREGPTDETVNGRVAKVYQDTVTFGGGQGKSRTLTTRTWVLAGPKAVYSISGNMMVGDDAELKKYTDGVARTLVVW